MRKGSRALAFAYCNNSALAIATNTLAWSARFKRVDILGCRLLSNNAGYLDFTSLINTTLCSTQALLRLSPGAALAMTVTQERIVEVSTDRRRRHTFSIGLVAACCTDGPLAIFSAADWLPEDERERFERESDKVLRDAQLYYALRPSEETVEIAETVGRSLMDKLHFEVSASEETIH